MNTVLTEENNNYHNYKATIGSTSNRKFKKEDIAEYVDSDVRKQAKAYRSNANKSLVINELEISSSTETGAADLSSNSSVTIEDSSSLDSLSGSSSEESEWEEVPMNDVAEPPDSICPYKLLESVEESLRWKELINQLPGNYGTPAYSNEELTDYEDEVSDQEIVEGFGNDNNSKVDITQWMSEYTQSALCAETDCSDSVCLLTDNSINKNVVVERRHGINGLWPSQCSWYSNALNKCMMELYSSNQTIIKKSDINPLNIEACSTSFDGEVTYSSSSDQYIIISNQEILTDLAMPLDNNSYENENSSSKDVIVTSQDIWNNSPLEEVLVSKSNDLTLGYDIHIIDSQSYSTEYIEEPLHNVKNLNDDVIHVINNEVSKDTDSIDVINQSRTLCDERNDQDLQNYKLKIVNDQSNSVDQVKESNSPSPLELTKTDNNCDKSEDAEDCEREGELVDVNNQYINEKEQSSESRTVPLDSAVYKYNEYIPDYVNQVLAEENVKLPSKLSLSLVQPKLKSTSKTSTSYVDDELTSCLDTSILKKSSALPSSGMVIDLNDDKTKPGNLVTSFSSKSSDCTRETNVVCDLNPSTCLQNDKVNQSSLESCSTELNKTDKSSDEDSVEFTEIKNLSSEYVVMNEKDTDTNPGSVMKESGYDKVGNQIEGISKYDAGCTLLEVSMIDEHVPQIEDYVTQVLANDGVKIPSGISLSIVKPSKRKTDFVDVQPEQHSFLNTECEEEGFTMLAMKNNSSEEGGNISGAIASSRFTEEISQHPPRKFITSFEEFIEQRKLCPVGDVNDCSEISRHTGRQKETMLESMSCTNNSISSIIKLEIIPSVENLPPLISKKGKRKRSPSTFKLRRSKRLEEISTKERDPL